MRPYATYKFRNFPAVAWIVAVNVAILASLIVVGAIGDRDAVYGWVAEWLDVSPGAAMWQHPWTMLTYSFVHTDVMHCLFNMLCFYWVGTMLSDRTSTRFMLLVYGIGAVGGALAFWLAQLHGAWLQGASAAVMGVIIAVAVIAPQERVRLFMMWSVKMWWIAVLLVVLLAADLMGNNPNNPGGQIAHIGGILSGAVAGWIYRFRQMRAVEDAPRSLTEVQARAELDRLLDKVRTSGYNSLTNSERIELIKLSKQV